MKPKSKLALNKRSLALHARVYRTINNSQYKQSANKKIKMNFNDMTGTGKGIQLVIKEYVFHSISLLNNKI